MAECARRCSDLGGGNPPRKGLAISHSEFWDAKSNPCTKRKQLCYRPASRLSPVMNLKLEN